MYTNTNCKQAKILLLRTYWGLITSEYILIVMDWSGLSTLTASFQILKQRSFPLLLLDVPQFEFGTEFMQSLCATSEV